MDQSETIKDCSDPLYVNSVHSNDHPLPRQGIEADVQEKSVTGKKLKKSVQEKRRRDNLSRQLNELDSVIDQPRFKKDQETLIDNTIKALVCLTAEVNKLKSDAAMLSQEKIQLAHEKNELKKERESLKSEIESLKKIHQQQRLRFMSPWPLIDQTVVIAPPPMPYSYPFVHPWLGFQNHGPVPNASSAFVAFPACSNSSVNQPRTSMDTKLELKTPGSTSIQEVSKGDRKGKRPLIVEKSRKNKTNFSSRNLSPG